MAEINYKEQIKRLYDLQKIDTQIYQLRRESDEKPLQIEELKKQFEEKKANLKNLEEKSRQLQLKRKDKEGELSSKEESIKKLQTQLYSIKTNKEYTAMVTEIESAKADKSVLEEEILKFLDGVDVLNAEIEKEKGHVVEEEKMFNAKKKELEDRIKQIEEELKKLEANRSQIAPGIDKKILAQYERILKNRDGLALVPVKDFACGGCHMKVTPQVVNEIKMKDRVVVCELCARILYIEEEL